MAKTPRNQYADATHAGLLTADAQVVAGVKTFDDAPIITDASGIVNASATGAGTLSYESSGEFEVNFTGPASITTTVKYIRVGRQVTIYIPYTQAVSTVATYFTALGAIPETLRPIGQVFAAVIVKNSGVNQDSPGYLDFRINGDMYIYRAASSVNVNFSDTGVVGTDAGVHISYICN